MLKTMGVTGWCLSVLLAFAIPPSASAEGVLTKRNMVSVAALLDPSNPLHGHEVMVFGYFTKTGSDTAAMHGRICIDRESMKRGYSPNCLAVSFPTSLGGMASFADERYVQIVGVVVPENILSSYPGRLTQVTRIERYQAQ